MPKVKRKTKGCLNRKKFYFKPGNIPHNKGVTREKSVETDVTKTLYKRLSEEKYNLVTKRPSSHSGIDKEEVSVQYKFLQPIKTKDLQADLHASDSEQKKSGEKNTYRLVQIKTNEEMWNSVFTEHKRKYPMCNGNLEWEMESEEKHGLAWRERAKCKLCTYRSDMFSLYEEAPTKNPGRKAAMINKGIQIGLSQTSIGNSSLRSILLSANVPAPSKSGMQNASNSAAHAIEAKNRKDMDKIREEIKEVNLLRGNTAGIIDIQCDGMYNNAMYSGVGKTPFHPATQCSYIQVENITHTNKVINVVTKIKLCNYGKFHTSQEEVDNCTCSANITVQRDIGDEKSWSKEGLLELKLQSDMEVKNMTTDPDSSSYRAAVELHVAGTTNTFPKNFIDTRHLGQNHRKFIKKSNVLTNLMPGKNKVERERMKNNFSIDLSKRCHAEFNAAFEKYCGDTSMIMREMSRAVDAIVLCYQGDYVLCKTKSYVCTCENANWVVKSSYLPGTFRIVKSTHTESMIRMLVNYRLWKMTIEKTYLNTNTQKSECVNKVIRRSLPRNVTFKRNFHAWCHSAVHYSNSGPGESIVKLCQASGCPIAASSSVAMQLKRRQKEHIFIDKTFYKKKKAYKHNKCKKRALLFRLYEKYQERNYAKGRLLCNIGKKLRAKYDKNVKDLP